MRSLNTKNQKDQLFRRKVRGYIIFFMQLYIQDQGNPARTESGYKRGFKNLLESEAGHNEGLGNLPGIFLYKMSKKTLKYLHSQMALTKDVALVFKINQNICIAK